MLYLRLIVLILLGICGSAACAETSATIPQSESSPSAAVDGSAKIAADKSAIRYQAIALPKPNGAVGDRLMILDTQTGDVWQWWDNVAQHVGHTGVTYMGRLKPGSKPGETITYQRFDAQ